MRKKLVPAIHPAVCPAIRPLVPGETIGVEIDVYHAEFLPESFTDKCPQAGWLTGAPELVTCKRCKARMKRTGER